jgi:membrane protease YdiL (CAAX protease family)
MESPDEAGRRVGIRLRGGAILCLGLMAALGLGTELTLPHVLGLPLFLVLFPTLALAQTPLLPFLEVEREDAYLSSGFTILALGSLALALAVMGPGLEEIGLRALAPEPFLFWTLGLTVGGVVFSLAMSPLEQHLWSRTDTGRAETQMMELLLPQTGDERRLFSGLSLAAGWGEELAYRGYVPGVFVLLGVNPWLAMAAAAVPFGVLHAYQGPVGIVRTGILGFLFGVSVVWTGSLFPAMVAHALMDLVLGLLVGPYLLRNRS